MLRLTPITGTGYGLYLEAEALEQAYWQGEGARLLDLAGERVTVEDFDRLSLAIDPYTGESLKYRPNERALHDGVVHAPKSLSVLAIEDSAVIAAHQAAVRGLMQRMEPLALAKVDGIPKRTQNLLMADYQHYSSRAGDIHLHSHIAIVNLTYDQESQSWRALRAQEIYKYRRDLTEGYRKELAARVENLGYRITDRPTPAKWLDNPQTGWEVEGVSKEMLERFSRRAAEIDKRLKEDPSLSIRNVGDFGRKNKPEELISYQEYLRRQGERLEPTERQQLKQVVERAQEHRHSPRFRLQETPDYAPGLRVKPWTYGQRAG